MKEGRERGREGGRKKEERWMGGRNLEERWMGGRRREEGR